MLPIPWNRPRQPLSDVVRRFPPKRLARLRAVEILVHDLLLRVVDDRDPVRPSHEFADEFHDVDDARRAAGPEVERARNVRSDDGQVRAYRVVDVEKVALERPVASQDGLLALKNALDRPGNERRPVRAARPVEIPASRDHHAHGIRLLVALSQQVRARLRRVVRLCRAHGVGRFVRRRRPAVALIGTGDDDAPDLLPSARLKHRPRSFYVRLERARRLLHRGPYGGLSREMYDALNAIVGQYALHETQIRDVSARRDGGGETHGLRVMVAEDRDDAVARPVECASQVSTKKPACTRDADVHLKSSSALAMSDGLLIVARLP